MTTNYVQRGEVIDFVAAAAVKSNDVVVVGTLLGVANTDVAKGDTGGASIVGVFDVPKKAGGAFTAGQSLVWSLADAAFVGGAGVAKDVAGAAVAFAPAAAGDQTVRVLLVPGHGTIVAGA